MCLDLFPSGLAMCSVIIIMLVANSVSLIYQRAFSDMFFFSVVVNFFHNSDVHTICISYSYKNCEMTYIGLIQYGQIATFF